MVTLQHRRKHHAWTPRSDAGLWIWHAADQQGGTDGVAVSQLTDLSGNGRHITTGASKPLYRASGVKGRPAFDFVGGRFISQSITPFTGNQIAWFMAVRLSTGTTVNGRLVSCHTPSRDYELLSACLPAYIYLASGTITLAGARASQLAVNASSLPNNAERVVSSVFGLTRFDLYSDGVLGGGSAVGGAFNFGVVEYGNGPFSEKSNSMIAEVFALTGTVDATRRTQAENYLRTKYR